MSTDLPGGRSEEDRDQQIRIRCPEKLVSEFDEVVENHDEYGSRSEALRSLLRREIGDTESDLPREPPKDDQLRTAYIRIVEMAGQSGTLPHNLITSELASDLGMSQKLVEHQIIHKLRRRGYLQQLSNLYGQRAWKLRGWDDC